MPSFFALTIPKALGIVHFSINGTKRLQNIIAYETPSAVFPNVLKIAVSTAEGVSFAIIFCNLLVPLIEKITIPKAFGMVKEKKEGK